MSALGAIVAGVAHEVRNPLFGISSTLDAMEARYGSTESGRYLEVLREQVDRLTRLMQELLDYGRPYTPELVPGRLGDAIEEARRAAQNVHQASDVRAVYQGGAESLQVSMDRPRLVRALTNLLENAVQHSPLDATVTVTARHASDGAGAWVEVAVVDRGRGIPPDDLAKVFEPFFTRRRGGTGLGLSIVQRIVEEHGGTVWARNGSGAGAILTVRLPVDGPPPAREAAIA
jgi:signal transduction histidine kinase